MIVAGWIALTLICLVIFAILYAPFVLSGSISREEESLDLENWLAEQRAVEAERRRSEMGLVA